MTSPLDAERSARQIHIDYLIKSLHDPDPSARRQAAQLLGELRAEAAVEALGDTLFDADITTRVQAVTALGLIGGRSVGPLLTALQNPDGQVRQAAAKALGSIADPRTIGPLITALRDANDVVRNQAAFALIKIGSEAAPRLLVCLNDPDPSVRWQTARILGSIGDARALPDLERLASQDRGKAHSTGSLVNVADAARYAVEQIKRKQGT